MTSDTRERGLERLVRKALIGAQCDQATVRVDIVHEAHCQPGHAFPTRMGGGRSPIKEAERKSTSPKGDVDASLFRERTSAFITSDSMD